jgi:hypothetical protein
MSLRDFLLETLSILLGDVLAVLILGFFGYMVLRKAPPFRIKVEWAYNNWDREKRGRLPNEWDAEDVEIMPLVRVISDDMTVQKVVSVIWVREWPDESKPGKIYGCQKLSETMPKEARTTAFENKRILELHGPKIVCPARESRHITKLPVFIETEDGQRCTEEAGIRKFVSGLKEHLFKRDVS